MISRIVQGMLPSSMSSAGIPPKASAGLTTERVVAMFERIAPSFLRIVAEISAVDLFDNLEDVLVIRGILRQLVGVLRGAVGRGGWRACPGSLGFRIKSDMGAFAEDEGTPYGSKRLGIVARRVSSRDTAAGSLKGKDGFRSNTFPELAVCNKGVEKSFAYNDDR